jgi:predicted ATPase
MAGHPFLKSIRPVNLLSFGPDTPEIELRPLNILIGPNGSGKSNLIEIVGLLSKLPDKDPWSDVIRTGGAKEWIWKGKDPQGGSPSLSIMAAGNLYPRTKPVRGLLSNRRSESAQEGLGSLYGTRNSEAWAEKPISYSIELRDKDSTFEVSAERFKELDRWPEDPIQTPWFERDGWVGHSHATSIAQDSPETFPSLMPSRSVLSMYGTSNIGSHVPSIQKFSEGLEAIAIYRDWVFGNSAESRKPQRAGFDSHRLAADSINLAQVLKAWRDRGDSAVFEQLIGLMRKFYEPIKDVDTELIGDYLRIMIKEEGLNSRTPAERLSDGTLRWLTLLIILFDPTPPPVICIDEPDLGLHPDMIPTLADLLRDASTRTQLVVTTHSTGLVDAFSDTPEVVCVCEKVEGATQIRRLDAERLAVWMEDYSLGPLWASGEIGGNRW